jgi:hypothetical protein
MTKLIGVLIVALVCWGGYELFELWDRYDTAKDIKAQEDSRPQITTGDQVGRMTPELEKTLEIATKRGAVGIKDWLNAYGTKVEDPRKAWIQLDYVVLLSRDNPAEAKKVFDEVKARTPENSPVYPRIQKLEQNYD